MPAKIENLTEYPTREVRKLVNFALKERDVYHRNDLLVRVKTSPKLWGAYKGRAYYQAWSHGASIYDWTTGDIKLIEVKVPRGINHLIICTIGLPNHYAKSKRHDRGLRGGPPTIEIENWQEAIIGITAHEAQHIWQYLNKKVEYTNTRTKRGHRRRKARFSEVECEWAEFRTIKNYREGR